MRFLYTKTGLITLSVFLMLNVSILPAIKINQQKGAVPGKFIIKFSDKAKPDILSKSLSQNIQLKKVSPLILKSHLKGKSKWDRFYLYYTQDKSLTSTDIIATLGEDNIEYIEPDYYLEFFEFPADSLFPHQWYLYNYGQPYLGIERFEGPENDSLVLKTGSAGKDIRLVEYYSNPPADHTRVIVAIIDSGVDLVHPELQGQFWRNPDEFPDNGIDDDHNGYVDDTLGYDVSGDNFSFFNPVGDNDPTDSYGHGTHLAGIVASRLDGKGIVGIAPGAVIMPIKIQPNASVAVAAEGIMYAVNAGAQVINISWGTPFVSGLLKEVLDFARENNVFVSIAPGNTGSTDRFYPAAFDSSFVVAAGNSDGYMTYFSTYGEHVNIVAPGLDILSLRAYGTDMYDYAGGEPGVRIIGDDSLYLLADGTSMSAPIVAGAAALIWSVKPSLTLSEMENILMTGATDMIDPFNQGDSLIGPDTISGYGYLNIDASLALLQSEGLAIIEPVNQNRYTDNVTIKAIPVGGYSGEWTLEYSIGADEDNWQYLSSGNYLPQDSILYIFNDTTLEGYIDLRLTDTYGSVSDVSFIHVRQKITKITSPISGQLLKYNIPIHGSAYGPNFDSVTVYYRKKDGTVTHLYSSTAEFYNSMIYHWTVSGIDTGTFKIYLMSYYDNEVIFDTTSIYVKSAFAAGWPRKLGLKGGITPVCSDLNYDGIYEIIVGSAYGLVVFHPDGSVVDGFPVMPGVDMRSIPAIYDVDRDGQDEIICTNADGIHIFNYDGSYVPGWPREYFTGLIPYGYSYPNPTVAQLDVNDDSAIVIINKIGQIAAFEFNGDPYFYSLGGLFASFDPRISNSYGYGGTTSPFVTSTDINKDGLYELVASYTSPFPYTGVGIFDGRTGLPAFGREDPLILTVPTVFGTALADFDGDQLLEIVTSGRDTLGIPHIWIKTNIYEDFPGWPVSLPEVQGWISSYPVLADLDLDDVPEILCTFFEYDISYLYILKADGTPYAQLEGAPYGVAFVDLVTFGTPTVANLTGDEFPEIIFRSGYIFPGTGSERVYILDNRALPLPEWPVATPAMAFEVFSSRFAPFVDDIDSDGLVELLLLSDNSDLLVWDFDASSENGKNRGRFLVDNLNTNILKLPLGSNDVSDELQYLPEKIELGQNYPNPFNPVTTIKFELPNRSKVLLEVFNILGQRVASLVDKEMLSGTHKIEFDGSTYASGVYLYRLTADETVHVKKMVLMK